MRKVFDSRDEIGVLQATQLVKVFFVSLPKRNRAALDNGNRAVACQVITGLVQVRTGDPVQALIAVTAHRKTERSGNFGVLGNIRHGFGPVVLSRNREPARTASITGVIHTTVRIAVIGVVIVTHGTTRVAFGSVVFQPDIHAELDCIQVGTDAGIVDFVLGDLRIRDLVVDTGFFCRVHIFRIFRCTGAAGITTASSKQKTRACK